MDSCGPSRTEAPRGEQYFMLVINDYLRLTWVAFLRNKLEEFEKFKTFKALAENQTRCKIKCIRLDRGGEFTSDEFVDLCHEFGIKQQYTIAGTLQQNGFIERKNRYV